MGWFYYLNGEIEAGLHFWQQLALSAHFSHCLPLRFGHLPLWYSADLA